MISRIAIQDWLDRPLRSISKLKVLSEVEVDRRIAAMTPRPSFLTNPRMHQKIAFLAASKYDSLMIMFGLGLGKTYTSLMIITDKINCGVAKKALVLVPTVTVCGVWEDEARIHAPHLRVQVIDAVGRDARMEQAMNPDVDIVVVTYQGFLSMCSKTERNDKKPGKNKWVLGKHADKLIKQFDILVCDECFAKGTLIDLLIDGKITPTPIESVKVGDVVLNANGVGHVRAVSMRRIKKAVQVRFGGRTIICSSNHLWCTVHGWRRAEDLQTGDHLVKTAEAVCLVRDGVHTTGSSQGRSDEASVLREILLSEVEAAESRSQGQSLYGESFAEDERRHGSMAAAASGGIGDGGYSDWESPSYAEQNRGAEDDQDKDQKRNASTVVGTTGRERHRLDRGGDYSGERIGGRVDADGDLAGAEAAGLPNVLQSGLRESSPADSHRSGWPIAQLSAGTGCEEGREAGVVRVDGVEILESADRRLDADRYADGSCYFYDLEVAGHPSFSVGGVLVHNSTAIKSADSLYFRMCRKIANHARFRYCLTGTPFGTDPQDLWSQYYVLDGGESLGESLGLLREACFSGSQGYFGGTEWTLKKSSKPDIRRFLDHSTLRYEESECIDLPPQIFQTIHVPAPADLLSYYERIVHDFREASGDITVMQNVFVLMRQLTSGFMTGRDDAGEKVYKNFNPNPKLDACRELIELLPPQKKMVIFHTYVHTGELLQSLVGFEMGINHERVWGAATQKNERINRFRKDPDCRILILNDQAGALGLNLQAANYVIYYECPVSPIVRQQADKRCHRSGQTETVHYWDLVMRGTVDEKILKAVRAGKDLMEELLRGRMTIDDGPCPVRRKIAKTR